MKIKAIYLRFGKFSLWSPKKNIQPKPIYDCYRSIWLFSLTRFPMPKYIKKNLKAFTLAIWDWGSHGPLNNREKEEDLKIGKQNYFKT